MKRLESIGDEMQGVVTYEVAPGRYIRFAAAAVREYGLAALLINEGIELPTERVPVIQGGQRVGTVPPDFDPLTIKSHSFLYDPRPGDLRRDGDAWVASKTLGPGDLDAIQGFVRDGALNRNR